MANTHYTEEHREYMRKRMTGENNPSWRGGTYKDANGYIFEKCRNHPFAYNNGYVLQHRLVMEKYIKRFLLPHEIVHHINGVRDDNRIENLQLLNGLAEHNTIHKTRNR